jgi:hypothetical protein
LALRREQQWLQKQENRKDHSEPDRYRRNDLRSACLSILHDSPTDYNGWVKRCKARRQSGAEAHDGQLIASDRRWWDKYAVRAMAKLIELAVSDLEACRAGMPKRLCGPLKVAAVTVQGKTGRAHMLKMSQIRAAKRAEEDAQRKAWIEGRNNDPR